MVCLCASTRYAEGQCAGYPVSGYLVAGSLCANYSFLDVCLWGNSVQAVSHILRAPGLLEGTGGR